MFRDLTRKNHQLTPEDCINLLRTETRGVLSVLGDEGYPYGMPMNHWYNDADSCIYFHCGKSGHRLDALNRCAKVSFCVFDRGFQKDGEWALNVKSVIVFGNIEIIDDSDMIALITRQLCYKFTHDEAYIQKEIQAYAPQTLLLKLIPAHMCGKWVKEA